MEGQDTASLPRKSLCTGVALILFSNIVYILDNYTVSWFQLLSTEVTLVRGIVQVIVFGVVILLKNRRPSKHDTEDMKEFKLPITPSQWLLISLYGVLMSSVSIAGLAAIPLMPIGDLIVLFFTTPVFAVFFELLILRRPIRFISLALCCLIVLGDILVVQPSFIFPSPGPPYNNNSITNSSGGGLTPLTADDLKQDSQNYLLGVGLSLFASATCAASIVMNVKITESNASLTTEHLVLAAGIFSVLLPVISTVFLPNRLITEPQALSLSSALALPVAAVMTLLAFWFVTLAVSITQHPTLISMLRSTEIIISLVTESVWWGQPPHYLSVIGSLLVMLSVVTMTNVDFIHNKWSRMRSHLTA